ncbi:kinase-like domain-containing protein [Nemania sp. NC0429]|nr:kinase-like domain-containing protein [Nemania sp. NC0429]
MSSSNSQRSSSISVVDNETDWMEEFRIMNHFWNNYRINGHPVHQSNQKYMEVYREYRARDFRPYSGTLNPLFFEAIHWEPTEYSAGVNTGNRIESGPGFDVMKLPPKYMGARSRYKQMREYFGPQRYEAQKVLGFGGFGIAAHFVDRGPDDADVPEKDIVIKVGRKGWRDKSLAQEKEMMKKVKGSAHCVQMIDIRDPGQPGKRPRTRPLPYEDSSTDGDSSGNESLSRAEVLRTHRVPKRKRRPQQYWARKHRRRRERDAEILEEIQSDVHRRSSIKDYIAMEYMKLGNLASLITKLNSHAAPEELSQIPNRVLWAFWLCLIRACIAMEYPPRKFHPLRKRTGRDAVVPTLRAKANGMVQDCIRLGIKLFNPQDLARWESEQNRSAGDGIEEDLIEELPNPNDDPRLSWKMERRQNMIHCDLDPTNIFIGGFELDATGFGHWEKKTHVANHENFQYTDRRPGRVGREHELVPRLKVGDFGMAQLIKPEKTNQYYNKHRGIGKLGEHPPESFGGEWMKVEADRYGDQLANSRIAGFYTNKTNIWQIGMTMWELITRWEPPIPPAPQPPYEEVGRFPPWDPYRGGFDYDTLLGKGKYRNFKISYCPLLMDPEAEGFEWIDEDLRATIYKCLYHKPDDRPSLRELLKEAEEKIDAEFKGESDDFIREWVQYWLFDVTFDPDSSGGSAPPPGPDDSLFGDDGNQPGPSQPPSQPLSQPPSQHPSQPPSQPPSGRESRSYASLFGSDNYRSPPSPPPSSAQPAGDQTTQAAGVQESQIRADAELAARLQQDDINLPRQQLQIRFNADFPWGFENIETSGEGLQCGLLALASSLQAQLGSNPVVNGVEIDLGELPSADDLRILYEQMSNEGKFDAFSYIEENEEEVSIVRLGELENNFNIDVLAAILIEWGKRAHIELALGYIVKDRNAPFSTATEFDNPRFIWIYNDDAEDQMAMHSIGSEIVLSHYEGLRPQPNPYGVDASDLPDYEDYEEEIPDSVS